MTETPSNEPELPAPDDDALLSLLVSAVNGSAMEVGVTLNVPGATVSGILVSADTWLNGLIAAYDGRLSSILGPIKEAWDQHREETEDQGLPNYIHLRDARVLFGATTTPALDNDGTFWRGRLSQVSGWFFGTTSPGRA